MSMSGKGEPYDNAVMESFLSTLKAECVERHDFQTPDHARPRPTTPEHASSSTWRSSTTGNACTRRWAIAHRWPSSKCRSLPDSFPTPRNRGNHKYHGNSQPSRCGWHWLLFGRW